MNIDSHQHFWHYDPGRDAWNTDEMSALKRDFLPENLILPLPANHVEGSIAAQAAQSEADTTFLLELGGRFDEIKGVGWVDFCSPNLPVGQLQQFDSGEITPWAEQVRTCSQPKRLLQVVRPYHRSGLEKVAPVTPYLDVVFDTLGIDRLMFGSDWSVCPLAADYREAKQLIAGYLDDFPLYRETKSSAGSSDVLWPEDLPL
jgi:predicted TIM-barrel fold metal-dependent hydrolase